jgi:hypothetical protein
MASITTSFKLPGITTFVYCVVDCGPANIRLSTLRLFASINLHIRYHTKFLWAILIDTWLISFNVQRTSLYSFIQGGCIDTPTTHHTRGLFEWTYKSLFEKMSSPLYLYAYNFFCFIVHSSNCFDDDVWMIAWAWKIITYKHLLIENLIYRYISNINVTWSRSLSYDISLFITLEHGLLLKYEVWSLHE